MSNNKIYSLNKVLEPKGGQGNILLVLLLISLFALLLSACNSASAGDTVAATESQAPDPAELPEATTAPAGPQILYTSRRDGIKEVFVMNSDGSDQHQLTDVEAIDFEPASDVPEWHLAFVQAEHPTWSSDNQQISFGFIEEIFVMNADGSGVRQVTDEQGSIVDPIWSPDGQHIAFISNQDGDRDIWIIATDGSDLRQVTDNREADHHPVWSPDGQTIAFSSGFPVAIQLINAAGGDSRPLVDGKDGYGWEPAWSPDGQQFAFISSRDGDDEIFIINVDGSDLRQLTDNSAKDGSPAWSADGQQLAFTSDRDGDLEIYVMNADGSDERQLTDNDVDDEYPAWSYTP